MKVKNQSKASSIINSTIGKHFNIFLIFYYRLGNGHINFDKFWQLAKQVTEVVAWQQITCPFPKVQTVINSLQTAPIFGESGKWKQE